MRADGAVAAVREQAQAFGVVLRSEVEHHHLDPTALIVGGDILDRQNGRAPGSERRDHEGGERFAHGADQSAGSGLSSQWRTSRVKVPPEIRQPAAAFTSVNRSTPQWL